MGAGGHCSVAPTHRGSLYGEGRRSVSARTRLEASSSLQCCTRMSCTALLRLLPLLTLLLAHPPRPNIAYAARTPDDLPRNSPWQLEFRNRLLQLCWYYYEETVVANLPDRRRSSERLAQAKRAQYCSPAPEALQITMPQLENYRAQVLRDTFGRLRTVLEKDIPHNDVQWFLDTVPPLPLLADSFFRHLAPWSSKSSRST